MLKKVLKSKYILLGIISVDQCFLKKGFMYLSITLDKFVNENVYDYIQKFFLKTTLKTL